MRNGYDNGKQINNFKNMSDSYIEDCSLLFVAEIDVRKDHYPRRG
jgi:hypothetical protein